MTVSADAFADLALYLDTASLSTTDRDYYATILRAGCAAAKLSTELANNTATAALALRVAADLLDASVHHAIARHEPTQQAYAIAVKTVVATAAAAIAAGSATEAAAEAHAFVCQGGTA